MKVTKRKAPGYTRNVLQKEEGSFECQLSPEVSNTEAGRYLLFKPVLFPPHLLFLDVTLEGPQQLLSSRVEDTSLEKS